MGGKEKATTATLWCRLYTYSGELIQVLGPISVTVWYKDQVQQLSLLVIPTDGLPLFGRDWLHTITLDWKQLNHVNYVRHRALQDVLDQYAGLFKEGMGTVQATTVKIHVQPNPHPPFFVPDPFRTPFETKSLPNSTDCARLTLAS